MNAEASSPTVANINEAIDWLQKTGAQVQDFAVEQAPLYCREVVAWEFWMGIINSSFGFLFLVTPLVMLWRYRQWFKEDLACLGTGSLAASILVPLISAGGLITIFNCAPQTVKAAVAPRLVIVEHLRGLTK
jgi:hypothetical protein